MKLSEYLRGNVGGHRRANSMSAAMARQLRETLDPSPQARRSRLESPLVIPANSTPGAFHAPSVVAPCPLFAISRDGPRELLCTAHFCSTLDPRERDAAKIYLTLNAGFLRIYDCRFPPNKSFPFFYLEFIRRVITYVLLSCL